MPQETELPCPACDGRGTVPDRRGELLASLTAVYVELGESDQNEVDFYAQYLRAKRRRGRRYADEIE